MRKIYFDGRCLEMIPDVQPCLTPAGVCSAVEEFRTSSDRRLVLPSQVCGSDTGDVVRTLFKEVDAAGGLVRDREGNFLLIRRSGLWDLPKGHREEGETMETAALREVGEETGVGELELGGLICTTHHCYFRYGVWHLKHTVWYAMRTSGGTDLVPQTEEGISEAVWVKPEEVPFFIERTYPSIREVFENAGF